MARERGTGTGLEPGTKRGLTDFLAAHISLAGEALPASAGHGSPGKGVVHLAVCIGCTGIYFCAGIPAIPIETGQLAVTVHISLATRIWWWRYYSGKGKMFKPHTGTGNQKKGKEGR